VIYPILLRIYALVNECKINKKAPKGFLFDAMLV
jgi:hypothetical protein